MAVKTSAGTTFSVTASTPATFNKAGYEALSYTAVGEVTDLGTFGREFNLITHNPIASRGTVKRKGSFNEGTIDLQLGLDTDDAGQVIMKAASLSDNDYSFKVYTAGFLDAYYFQAQVMQWKVNVGNVDQIQKASTKLELTTTSAGVGVVEVLS